MCVCVCTHVHVCMCVYACVKGSDMLCGHMIFEIIMHNSHISEYTPPHKINSVVHES